MKTEFNYWENVYKNTPPDQISWNRVQADYFKHAVDDIKVKGETALDIGCGTGLKSLYLADHGFNTVGLDISPSAIKYCKDNPLSSQTSCPLNFYVANILDNLSFIKNERFDFILDWTALHCLDRTDHPRYLSQILEHSDSGSYYMLRVFSSSDKSRDHFIDEKYGVKNKICIMQRTEIEKMFSPHFDVLEFKTSKPHRPDNLFFIEFLMQRK